MCFGDSRKDEKYYYHEEIIPVRRHPRTSDHHHHSSSGHHHHHHSSVSLPRSSYHATRTYTTHSPRASVASYRSERPVVYERSSKRIVTTTS